MPRHSGVTYPWDRGAPVRQIWDQDRSWNHRLFWDQDRSWDHRLSWNRGAPVRQDSLPGAVLCDRSRPLWRATSLGVALPRLSAPLRHRTPCRGE
ncbi:MAG: hypothetical protein NTV33_13855 [Coprothermobacterota bacterium]|nr:hypothetical protein [Coprothermobacterota bacterium]